MNRAQACGECNRPVEPGERLCAACLGWLLWDTETLAEPALYAIAVAFAGLPLCETRGLGGLMATMPQLEPNVYMVHEAGHIVADATRRDDGSWTVEFYSGVTLSPGCIIV